MTIEVDPGVEPTPARATISDVARVSGVSTTTEVRHAGAVASVGQVLPATSDATVLVSTLSAPVAGVGSRTVYELVTVALCPGASVRTQLDVPSPRATRVPVLATASLRYVASSRTPANPSVTVAPE